MNLITLLIIFYTFGSKVKISTANPINSFTIDLKPSNTKQNINFKIPLSPLKLRIYLNDDVSNKIYKILKSDEDWNDFYKKLIESLTNFVYSPTYLKDKYSKYDTIESFTIPNDDDNIYNLVWLLNENFQLQMIKSDNSTSKKYKRSTYDDENGGIIQSLLGSIADTVYKFIPFLGKSGNEEDLDSDTRIIGGVPAMLYRPFFYKIRMPD